MAVTDAPAVSIGGVQLASSWTTTERIALGGLRITWGRSSHLQKAKAAQLYLEVIDTDGHLASAEHLTGLPIIVTRGDGRVIFRGRVDDYGLEHTHVHDADTAYRRRVWRLKLSAGCKLAELGQAILPGPGNLEPLVAVWGPDYWNTATPAARIAQLTAQGVAGIVDGVSFSTPYPSTSRQPILAAHPFADRLSALDHLEAIYQTVPLGYVEYRPFNNTIRVGQPISTSGLALTYTSGVLRIDFRDGAPGRSVPARTVGVPQGSEARTGLLDAIDVVQVTSPQLSSGSPFTVEHATSRPSGHGRNVHAVHNDVMVAIDQAADVGDFEWPFPLAEVTSEYGNRPGIGSGFHTGIDFSGDTAADGADVPAAGPGTFAGSRSHPDWGNNVIIDHGLDINGDRLRTVYCHLKYAPSYPIGYAFDKGHTIGQVGNTGLSFGSHLHFETLVNGADVNPRWFMANKQYGQNHTDTYHDQWQRSLASDTAALLDQLNGKLTLPPVRFDWRRFEYSEAVDNLIDTYVRTDVGALYFPGSVFNVALDAATTHQVIGGTLVYHKGWTLDATLAPALSTGQGVTINQLCAADAPTIADFDPDITLADLGNVTQGVPA